MNRPRLQHAIALMERVRDQGLPFNMGLWFADKGNPEDCGTAACFGGWSRFRDPEFDEPLAWGLMWTRYLTTTGGDQEPSRNSLVPPRDTRFLTMPKAYGSYGRLPGIP